MNIKTLSLILLSRIYGLLSILLRPFIRIEDNFILFWSWNSKQYSCNPKAITEFLQNYHTGEFSIYWSFKGNKTFSLPNGVTPLRWGSLSYLLTAMKCRFLISNSRNDIETMLFYKRKNQKYIMTWHAGMGLKKAEKDIENTLNKKYLERCKYDSKICDLMISGSQFQTNLFGSSFWYNGEILNNGTPRNDILFSDAKSFKKLISEKYLISEGILILYAPTYRSYFDPNVVSFNWTLLKDAIEEKFHKRAILLVRLHPNISKMSKLLNFEFNNKDCIDVTDYPDMQELLLASDLLITDYSSSMFDFSLMYKPCFLLVKDMSEFDRSFYFSFRDLPYEAATTDEELLANILEFDQTLYVEKVKTFNEKNGSFEKGNACENLYNWMITQSNSHRKSKVKCYVSIYYIIIYVTSVLYKIFLDKIVETVKLCE